MAVKQTAGRDSLGEFAPKFAELNDDVLFGEVWMNLFLENILTFKTSVKYDTLGMLDIVQDDNV